VQKEQHLPLSFFLSSPVLRRSVYVFFFFEAQVKRRWEERKWYK
jgi:hypothetical protein